MRIHRCLILLSRIGVIGIFLNLCACGTFLFTREAPAVKKRYDFSPGFGLVAYPTPFQGGIVRSAGNSYGTFAAFRFGLTDDVELMAAGSLTFFASSAYDLRVKWKWYDEKKWLVSSSLFYISEESAPVGTQQTYIDKGFGISTAAGLRWDAAAMVYFGAKLTSLNMSYQDTHFIPNPTNTYNGVVFAGFAGLTYQYFIAEIPFEADFMATLAMLPKSVGDNTLSPYPAATLSLWYRH